MVWTHCVWLLHEEIPDWKIDKFAISFGTDSEYVVVNKVTVGDEVIGTGHTYFDFVNPIIDSSTSVNPKKFAQTYRIIGMPDTVVVVVALLIGAALFRLLPVFLASAIHVAVQTVGPTVVMGTVGVVMLLFYGALVIFRRSLSKAFADLVAFGVFSVAWVVSKFATAIRRIGLIISLASVLRSLLGLYPNKDFAETPREKIAERAIKLYEQGDVEIDDSTDEIIREIHHSHNKSGSQVSNGESVLGLALAGFTLLPSDSTIVPFSSVLTSQFVGASLSITLVLVVTLRLSVLDMTLVGDPSPDDHIARLEAYRSWNEAVASGEVISHLLMFRVMYQISEPASDFYIDWTLERSINGHGVGRAEAIRELWRPVFAFIEADRDGISPTQASQGLYERDVFAQFNFGPGRDVSPSEQSTDSLLDAVLDSFIYFKQIVQIHAFANQQGVAPEQASRELYGGQILSVSTDESDDDEEERGVVEE